MAETSKSRITTGKVLLSFVHVFKPTAIEEGQEPKYNMQVIVSKKDKATLAKINAAVDATTKKVLAEKYGNKMPKKWKTPLRDGDEEKEDEEAYENSFFFAATSKRKPKVVDKNFNEILDPEELYSGCYAAVCINFYAFDVAGNKGIAAGLESIMKLSDGEPLGGSGGNVRDDFADFADMDDDEFDI